MRPLKALMSLDKAQELLNEFLPQINETEEVEILELDGRVSSEDIISDLEVPPFRRAAMDGYAVKASSTFTATEDNPVVLQCIEIIHAGEVPTKQIDDKSCIEIATGAMVPDSADTVIQVELTNQKGDQIEILKALAPGTNVSRAGVDVKKGDVVVRKGDIFTPARIGVLAALNHQSAKVYRKPEIAIIPTGREISALGTELKKGQVYDINSYTITTLVKKHGGIPHLYPIIPDSFDELEKAVLDALKYDYVLILGGSSVGERDINIDVIEKHGEIHFHGVQIKPGKPTLFGTINGTPILNLPGYPTSCLTNGYVFVAPLIRKMAHLPPETKRTVKARVSRKIVSRLGRHQIFTVRLENGLAVPAFKESGAITSMAWADGYIEIPYNLDYIEKGEEVIVTLF